MNTLAPDARVALLRIRNQHVTKELDSCGAQVKQLTALSNELAKQFKELRADESVPKEQLRAVHNQYLEYYKELSFYVDIRKPMLRETSFVRGELRAYNRSHEDEVRGLGLHVYAPWTRATNCFDTLHVLRFSSSSCLRKSSAAASTAI